MPISQIGQNQQWQQNFFLHSAVSNFIYFFGFPLLLGLFIGWGLSPAEEFRSHATTAIYFAGFVQIGWLTSILAIQIGYIVLAPWRPPLWLLTTLVPVVLGWLALFPMNQYLFWANKFLPPGTVAVEPLLVDWSNYFFVDYGLTMLPVCFLLLVVHYCYDRVLAIPRFRYASTIDTTIDRADNQSNFILTENQSSFDSLPFMSLLPLQLRGEPLAIQAQEHYIKVWTTKGQTLIKYAFGNAILNLESIPGMQIHRSYWVSDNAVVALQKNGPRYFIKLINDIKIPVSQTRLNAVKDRFPQP